MVKITERPFDRFVVFFFVKIELILRFGDSYSFPDVKLYLME